MNFEIFANECKVNIIGGEYRTNRKDFIGYIAETSVGYINFHQCFLGADGFNGKSHFMTTDFYSSRLCEIVIQHSQKKAILTDSTKFARSSFVNYCAISEPNLTVITDQNIPAHSRDILLGAGVKLLIAELSVKR